MIKRGKRICDRCEKEMSLKERKNPDNDIYNFVSIGWKNEKGRTISKNYDLCPSCMKGLNEFLRPEQGKTK